MTGERTLTAAMAAAVQQWQRQSPQWSRLQWLPHADRAAPVPPPPEFQANLLRALMQAESNCRARGEAATARLEMGLHGNHLQVTLSCLTEYWIWVFPLRPELGCHPRRRAKHRIVLPAAAPPSPRPWDETELYDPICVLSGNPATIELVRSLLYRLPCRRLWHAPSRRLVQAWLAAHPRCPLWIEDRHDGLVITSPTTPLIGVVPLPLRATPIWLTARKIFPWPPGNIYQPLILNGLDFGQPIA